MLLSDLAMAIGLGFSLHGLYGDPLLWEYIKERLNERIHESYGNDEKDWPACSQFRWNIRSVATSPSGQPSRPYTAQCFASVGHCCTPSLEVFLLLEEGGYQCMTVSGLSLS